MSTVVVFRCPVHGVFAEFDFPGPNPENSPGLRACTKPAPGQEHVICGRRACGEPLVREERRA